MENEAENKRESDTRDEDNLSYLMKTGGVIWQSAGETICLETDRKRPNTSI